MRRKKRILAMVMFFCMLIPAVNGITWLIPAIMEFTKEVTEWAIDSNINKWRIGYIDCMDIEVTPYTSSVTATGKTMTCYSGGTGPCNVIYQCL